MRILLSIFARKIASADCETSDTFTFAAVIEMRRNMREREKSDGGAAGADEDERKLAAQEDMQLDILKKVNLSITSHHSHHTIHITPFTSHHSLHTIRITPIISQHATSRTPPRMLPPRAPSPFTSKSP